MHATKVAGDLVREVRADVLRVIVVYDPVPSNLGAPNLWQAIAVRQHEAQEIMDNSLKEVGEMSAEIHTEIIEGQIAERIVDVASIRNTDMIIMGSRGHTGLASALLGSNSQKIISDAPCPVLIER